MDLVTASAGAILAVAAALCLVRMARGPRTADRVVALDTLVLVGVAALAVAAVRTRIGLFVDVLLVVSLVGFVATVTIAAFIERPGRRGGDR